MPSDFNTIRYILPKFRRGDYTAFVKLIHNSLTFDLSDAAKYRFYVLQYYYQYGWKATVDAFRIGKSTLYDWKKVFEKSRKKLDSLIPVSTKPHHLRVMETDLRLVNLIKAIREEYGNVSKYKLKIFVDEYARQIEIATISASVIGKIIKRRHFFFEEKKRSKSNKRSLLYPRLKKSPKEKDPGYLEMDSITLYVANSRYYFVTIIDVVTKYAWVKLVTSLSSAQAKLALIEFTNSYKYKFRVVQTDNGSEFLKEFDKYLQESEIIHLFIYQKSPQINAVVERFNRTIQEEFVERNIQEIYDTNQFREKLVKYLIWYNTKRPHQSLNYRTPMQYIQELTSIPKSM